MYQNPWSHVYSTVWGPCGGTALMEEVWHWGWTFKCLYPQTASSFLSVCIMFAVEEVTSPIPSPAPMPAAWSHASLPWWTRTGSQNKLFPALLLLTVSYHRNRKGINTLSQTNCTRRENQNRLPYCAYWTKVSALEMTISPSLRTKESVTSDLQLCIK